MIPYYPDQGNDEKNVNLKRIKWYFKYRLQLMWSRHQLRKQTQLDKIVYGEGFGYIWSIEFRILSDKVRDLYYKTYHGSYSNWRNKVWRIEGRQPLTSQSR